MSLGAPDQSSPYAVSQVSTERYVQLASGLAKDRTLVTAGLVGIGAVLGYYIGKKVFAIAVGSVVAGGIALALTKMSVNRRLEWVRPT